MKTDLGELVGRTVLLVDDDTDARAAFEELLTTVGCKVLTAANGLDALDLLKAGARPAVMVVDLEMPLMDGQRFCEACDKNSSFASIPRVLLTANPYAAFFHSRAYRVYSKPADTGAVLASLATVCALPRAA
ncbi:MAG: response regulator [Myxococcaceae bacterium]|nr:response regulator [Myxococcaceae bacterium]